MNTNPDIKIAKSKGIDRPILYVYLAGRIAGNVMDKCTAWRKQIREHYKNYKAVETPCSKCSKPEYRIFHSVKDCPECGGAKKISSYESYPIAFIDPLNSGETKTADPLGLTSHIPSNLIYDKDLLSVQRADIIVANVEDYFEAGIEEELGLDASLFTFSLVASEKDKQHSEENIQILVNAYNKLKEAILNRRENFGTICEIAWALYLQKPLILIVPENRKEIYMKHPFAKRASVIVSSVDELLDNKWLNTLYKSVSGATY